MPIPIQRPDFQQGTVDAFGLKGKTPFILDEVTVPMVQTLDLERSPYTLVPKRAMVSSFIAMGAPGTTNRGIIYVFPLNGFFGSIEWIMFTPSVNFFDEQGVGAAAYVTSMMPQRIQILFGSKTQFEAQVTPSFGFPWISLNQIPAKGSGSAGQFNAGLFMQGGDLPGSTGALSTIASGSVGSFVDPTTGFANPSPLQYHFDPPLPLYQQNGEASAIGVTMVEPPDAALPSAIPIDVSFKGSTYPESI